LLRVEEGDEFSGSSKGLTSAGGDVFHESAEIAATLCLFALTPDLNDVRFHRQSK
jgi:hypothetical protein